MTKVVIIGGGTGGSVILPILHNDREIEVAGIADTDRSAPAFSKAKKLDIPTFNDYRDMLSQIETDLIINVTGSENVSKDLHKIKKKGVEILEGLSAKLLYNLVEERNKRELEVIRSLKEQQVLYDIGIMLTSSEKEDELLNTIVGCAMQLTEMPAGSITLYDEREGTMEMVVASGFSTDFTGGTKWKVARGGLTELILNKGKTVVINDMEELSYLDRPALAEEGISSLIATPLIAERKIIGILYVDDFAPREFSKKDESILALLATQAATAIEKMQLLERTKKLAITDELTSLYNHRHFANLFKDELRRSKRYGRPLSVMLIDIDHFKHYNDTHGHLKGNDALKDVSSAMAESVRDIDVLARYGGEEFGIILPETGKDEAIECAERLREAVERRRFKGEDKQPLGRLTISIGMATYPEDAKRENTLLDRADVALYRAKKEGRNRVIYFSKKA